MSKSTVFNVDHDNEPFEQASQRARNTFKFMWREVSWENRRIVKGLGMAAVKLPFDTDGTLEDGPSVEHMWVSDLSFDGETIMGTLLNSPNDVAGIEEGDPVIRPLTDLTDWMYVIADKPYGGFTIQLIRAGLSEAERASHDSQWGLDFGHPDTVRLMPAPDRPDEPEDAPQPTEKPAGFFSKLFGKSAAPAPVPAAVPVDVMIPLLAPMDLSNPPEHPMSENAAPQIRAQLTEDPSHATYVDEEGWTLLQREALAGNLSPALALMDAGADPHVQNPQGRSTLDLALLMGWSRLANAISSRTA